MQTLLRLAAASALLAPFAASQNAGHVRPLFAPLTHRVDQVAESSSLIARGTPVQMNLHALYSCQRGDVLGFPGFDDVHHDLRVRERKAVPNFPDAFHVYCDLDSETGGWAILTVVGSRVAGILHSMDHAVPSLNLEPAPFGETALREVTLPEDYCGCGANHSGGSNPHAQALYGGPMAYASSTTGCTSDPAEITLMVAYDDLTLNRAGDQAGVEARILGAAAVTNQALTRSGVLSQIVVTSVRALGWSDANQDMNYHLSDMGDTYGGRQPGTSINNFRRADGADLAMMIVGQTSATGNVAGIAWTPGTDAHFNPFNGMSVVVWEAAGGQAFPHELGHNFGCQHDPAQSQSTFYRPYGQGYVNRFYSAGLFERRYAYTLMAYKPPCGAIACTWIGAYVFSNPDLSGTSGNRTFSLGTASHDNGRLMEETRLLLATYSDQIASGPAITQQPQNAAVCLGSQGSNTVIMSVQADRAASYDWQKQINGSWTPTGQITSELIFTNITANELGRYRCRITGCNDGIVLTRNSTLSQVGTPTITRQPADVQRDAGTQSNPAVMSVQATATTTYQWLKQISATQWQAVPGQDGAALNFSQLVCEDTGNYMCRVSNRCGESVDSNPAFLEVGPRGSAVAYGVGCSGSQIAYGSTFYESFGGFDLSFGALRYTPSGPGWVVSIETGGLDTRYANALGLGDDVLSRGHALGFTYPMPGGASTTAIDVDSNGWIGLQTGQHAGSQLHESVASFLNDPARIAVLWDDLNPGAAGEVYFDALADRALITWVDVPEYGTTRAFTFQIQLFPNGEFVIAYDNFISINDCLVGYSVGGGVVDPGAVDLTELNSSAPVLSAASLGPVIDETYSMRINHSTRTSSVIVNLGFLTAAVDLSPIGMTGCSLLNTADVSFPAARENIYESMLRLPLPNDPNLIRFQMHAQAMCLEAGANSLGILSSNGLTLTVGACY